MEYNIRRNETIEEISDDKKSVKTITTYNENALVADGVLTIPNGVTTIKNGERSRFGDINWKRVKKVIIPSSVERIGNSAFSDFYNLEEVVIEEGSKLKVIGENAFYGKKSLRSINLPEGLEYIYERAFYGTGLEIVKIPSSVKSIGWDSFWDCNNLEEFHVSNCKIVPMAPSQIHAGTTWSLDHLCIGPVGNKDEVKIVQVGADIGV